MLHPVMPFITEELYSYLPIDKDEEFLMSAKWPQMQNWYSNEGAESSVEHTFEVTRSLRALRAELGFGPGVMISEVFYEGNLADPEIVASQAWIGSLQQGVPAATHVSMASSDVDLHLPIGDIDVAKELERAEREIAKRKQDLLGVEKRLSDPTFLERAKPEIVEKTQSQAKELREQISKFEERRKLFEK
jgi:valyl-tRNA synthetase